MRNKNRNLEVHDNLNKRSALEQLHKTRQLCSSEVKSLNSLFPLVRAVTIDENYVYFKWSVWKKYWLEPPFCFSLARLFKGGIAIFPTIQTGGRNLDFLRPQEMFGWPLFNYEGKIENSKIKNAKKTWKWSWAFN